MYYEINEAMARQAQQANSFRDYIPGSATTDYRKEVDAATEIADRQKGRVSEFYHEKIDSLLDSYCKRLASWYNDSNRNRASCPSIMISGGSNFPVRKKEKQNAREHSLYLEYNEIQGILDKIKSIGTGAVDLADPHAREILEEQLQKLQRSQEYAKKLNAWFRKKGTCIGCPDVPERTAASVQAQYEEIHALAPYHDRPFPSYELSSIRGKIKRVQERLEQLEKLQSITEEEAETEYDGFSIVRNVELNRLQILFDGKPDEETRTALKSHGFRWSPKNSAWQRQMTDNAMDAARAALHIQ